MMKDYIGILISVIYALAFRILVEFGILEINSFTYLIIVPAVIGYIPLFIGSKLLIESRRRSILYPISSVILFLLIAFFTRLEDLGCFIILLPPYLIISVLVSLTLRSFLKSKNHEKQISNIRKNGGLLLLIPFVLGHMEQFAEKNEAVFQISEKVIINGNKEEIWNHLFEVPELTDYIEKSPYNFLGFPNPVKSTYDQSSNTRLGYFTNGVILHEKIVFVKRFEKVTFQIDVEKSHLENSQTFKHILLNQNVAFNSISYTLKALPNSKTELTLSCEYRIQSNIPLYGEFWSKKIISDFELKLLDSLKKIVQQ